MIAMADIRLLGRFAPFVRTRRRFLAATLLFSAGSSLSGVAVPVAVGMVVNDLDAAASRDVRYLLLHLAAMAMLFVILAVCNYGQVTASSRLAEGFIRDLRIHAFSSLTRQPMAFFDRKSSGDLASRLSRDIGDIQSFFSESAQQALLALITVAGALTAMLAISWRLSLIVICLLPLSLGLVLVYRNRLRIHASRQTRLLGAITSKVQETALHSAAIKAYSGEARETASFGRLCNRFHDSGVELSRTLAAHTIASKVLVYAAFTLALLAGFNEISQERLTSGGLVAMLMLAFKISQPVLRTAYFSTLAQKALAASSRVVEILDAPCRSETGDVTPDITRIPGRLRFDAVSYSYGRSGGVRNLNFTLAAGGFNVILGPSGSGKSTMLKLILGLYQPESGQVLIDGTPILQDNAMRFRRHMAYVPQEPLLFDRSIAENIAYGRPDATEEEIERAAEQAGALPFVTSLPRGFSTRVGELGALLSGGEKQRISLARAMLCDPSFLLLDEPTASLDPETEHQLMLSLRRMAVDRTTLLVTHKPALAAPTDHILLMNKGRLMASGFHESLISSSPDYASFIREKGC